MYDEKNGNREINEEDLIDFAKSVGIESLTDLRTGMEALLTYKIPLVPKLWEAYDNFNCKSVEDWIIVKFYDDDGNVSENVRNIPDDTGGLYAYLVKPDLPILNFSNIMYIGRAHNNGESINLKKRVYHYIYESNDIYKGRMQVRKLLNVYRKYLYVMYIPIEDNEEIDRMEKELVTAISPPINADKMNRSLSESQKMF